MNNYKYDEKTRTLTSLKDDSQEKLLEEFAKAPWFDKKFNIDVLLNDKKKLKEDRPPPELLFNLDGDRSLATIHDKNRKSNTATSNPKKKLTATPDPKKKSSIAFDLASDSSSSKSAVSVASSKKSESDTSSFRSSIEEDNNDEGPTPSLSNARSNSTALKVIESPLTLDNAQDSTMSG
jgi:hypothetical protein